MNKKLYIVTFAISMMSVSLFAGDFKPVKATKRSFFNRLALKAKSMVLSPETLLRQAIIENDAAQVEQLLYTYPQFDLNVSYWNENDLWIGLLSFAIRHDALDVVRYLLGDEECDVNMEEYRLGDNTPLMIAVCDKQISHSLAIIQELLNHKKIDVNKVNGLKQTALDLAIASKRADVIDLLLAHPGIDVNTGRYGSALCAAVVWGDVSIVRQLLLHDAINVNYLIRNQDMWEDSQDVLEDSCLQNNHTALTLAIEIGDIDVVRELLAHRSIDLKAGLVLAAAQGNLAMVKEFLQCNNIDINFMIKPRNGGVCTNALLQAAYYGHTAVMEALLNDPRIDKTVCDEDGQTALNIALKRKHYEIVRLLNQTVYYKHVKLLTDVKKPVALPAAMIYDSSLAFNTSVYKKACK